MRSDVQKQKYKVRFMFKKARNLSSTEQTRKTTKTDTAACKMQLCNAKQTRPGRLVKVFARSLRRLVERKIVNCSGA